MTEINVVAAILAVLLLTIAFVAVWLHGYKKGVMEMEEVLSNIIDMEIIEIGRKDDSDDR